MMLPKVPAGVAFTTSLAGMMAAQSLKETAGSNLTNTAAAKTVHDGRGTFAVPTRRSSCPSLHSRTPNSESPNLLTARSGRLER